MLGGGGVAGVADSGLEVELGIGDLCEVPTEVRGDEGGLQTAVIIREQGAGPGEPGSALCVPWEVHVLDKAAKGKAVVDAGVGGGASDEGERSQRPIIFGRDGGTGVDGQLQRLRC